MEKHISELWEDFKQPNICIMGVSEEKESEPEKSVKK